MKIILFFIILFFTSFSHEYREKFICHTIIKSSVEETCLVVVIRAENVKDAERKFNAYIRRQEKKLRGKESDNKLTYAISTLKNATMIEP